MLKRWVAETYEDVIQDGRTKPVVVGCVPELAEEGEYQRFVVKGLGHPEVTERYLFNELFGNLLARELGVQTPEPVLIEISPEMARCGSSQGIQLQPGSCAGCKYVKGMSDCPTTNLSSDEIADATAIYGFDLLTQNPDRRRLRPNCASLGGKVIAYDFEQCFSFTMMLVIGQAAPPWEVSRHGISYEHIFRPVLLANANPVDFRSFVTALSQVTDARLFELSSDIPFVVDGHFDAILKHIQCVRDRLDDFHNELYRSLG